MGIMFHNIVLSGFDTQFVRFIKTYQKASTYCLINIGSKTKRSDLEVGLVVSSKYSLMLLSPSMSTLLNVGRQMGENIAAWGREYINPSADIPVRNTGTS